MEGDSARHPDVAHLMTMVGGVADEVTRLRGEMQDFAAANSGPALQATIVAAMRQFSHDKIETTPAWEHGFSVFAGSARKSFAQYIGERVLAGLIVLSFGIIVTWAVLTGHVK